MRLFSIVAGVLAIASVAGADSSIPGEKPLPDASAIEGWMNRCATRLAKAGSLVTLADRSFAGWTIERGGDKANDYLTWTLEARPKQEAPRFLVRIGPALTPFVLRSPSENDGTRAVFDRAFQPAISGCVNDLAAVMIK
jgi:hypothetical protein